MRQEKAIKVTSDIARDESAYGRWENVCLMGNWEIGRTLL